MKVDLKGCARTVFAALCGAALLPLAACTQKAENVNRQNARDLYEKSLDITRLYLDSMKNAKDSAHAEGLALRFDEILTKINYSYPADTDLELSEGENDTLANLNRRLIMLKDSLLLKFSGRDKEVTPDSLSDNVHLAADTVKVKPKAVVAR